MKIDLTKYQSGDDNGLPALEQLRLVRDRIDEDLAALVHQRRSNPLVVSTDKPAPREFTVITVSSNANSFGYKGVLCLAADGIGVEVAFQAYGPDPLPKRGDVIAEDKLPKSPVWRELPREDARIALKVITEAKGGAK
jgi:hypothetical protein